MKTFNELLNKYKETNSDMTDISSDNRYYLNRLKEKYLKKLLILRGITNKNEKEKRNYVNDYIFLNHYIKDGNEYDLNDFQLTDKDFKNYQNSILLNYTNLNNFKDVLGTDKNLIEELEKWCKKYNITFLNRQEEADKTLDKRILHKLFDGEEWLSKSCFNLNDAISGKIGFPLIAKISNGHSGLGIQKFKSKNDLQKYPKTFKIPEFGEGDFKFDLFEQFLEIDVEYRSIWYKNKLVILAERVDIEMDTSMNNKKSSDKKEFVYVPCDLNKIPIEIKTKFNEIAEKIQSKIKVDVMGIDICFDSKGKINVLEVNYKSGLREEYIPEIYRCIYEDIFIEIFPPILFNYIKEIIIDKDRRKSYIENTKHWEKAMEIKKWRPNNWVVDLDFLI